MDINNRGIQQAFIVLIFPTADVLWPAASSSLPLNFPTKYLEWWTQITLSLSCHWQGVFRSNRKETNPLKRKCKVRLTLKIQKHSWTHGTESLALLRGRDHSSAEWVQRHFWIWGRSSGHLWRRGDTLNLEKCPGKWTVYLKKWVVAILYTIHKITYIVIKQC